MAPVTRRGLVAALFLHCLAQSAGAANTWYFRPDNGTGYGLRTGASYADAWHLDDRSTGPGHLDWSRIRPGDTLRICGFHHTGRDRSIRPTVSGTAGSPIVIDGACTNGTTPDRGIMLLANAEITRGWSGPDAYGGYSQVYAGNTGSQLIEDTDNLANGTAGLRRLKRRVGLPDGTWTCGSFAQAVGGARLYYKPSDADGRAGCDSPHWVYPVGADSVLLSQVSNIVLRNLVLLNQNRLVALAGARNIVIEKSELRWAAEAGIRARLNSDGGSILNNDIHDVQSGIYMENQVDYNNTDSMDNWVIAGNEIHDVDQDCYYACQAPVGKYYDTHGIAFQGGSNNLVERNHIHHVGGEAIIFYAMKRQTIRDNRIQYNYIHDVQDLNTDFVAHPRRSERGIVHGTSSEEVPDNTVNNLALYNVLVNVSQAAFRLKSSRPSTGYSWSILNNVVVNAGTTLAFSGLTNLIASGNKPGFRFQNNISVDPRSGLHLHQVGVLDGDASGILISNNLFSPDNTPGVFRYEWGQGSVTGYEALASWRSVSGRSGGIAGNPRFVQATGTFHWIGSPSTVPNGGDFELQDTSPAIDAGATTADAGAYDMDGQPLAGLRDIGAFEAAEAVRRRHLQAP